MLGISRTLFGDHTDVFGGVFFFFAEPFPLIASVARTILRLSLGTTTTFVRLSLGSTTSSGKMVLLVFDGTGDVPIHHHIHLQAGGICVCEVHFLYLLTHRYGGDCPCPLCLFVCALE